LVSELKQATACVIVDQFQVNKDNQESRDFSSWGELEAGEYGEEFIQDQKSVLVKSLQKENQLYNKFII
jgi:hypothetical protein